MQANLVFKTYYNHVQLKVTVFSFWHLSSYFTKFHSSSLYTLIVKH